MCSMGLNRCLFSFTDTALGVNLGVCSFYYMGAQLGEIFFVLGVYHPRWPRWLCIGPIRWMSFLSLCTGSLGGLCRCPLRWMSFLSLCTGSLRWLFTSFTPHGVGEPLYVGA
jgi:hypothetical protein